MRIPKAFIVVNAVFVLAITSAATAVNGIEHKSPDEFSLLTGPYLGQNPPGLTPERFAPDILPLEGVNHCFPAFGPAGREMFWMRVDLSGEKPRGEIWTTREIDGCWQPPARASFSGTFNDHAPVFSRGGTRLFFASDRPGGFSRCKNIWYVERTDTGWGEPKPLGSPPNTDVCASQATFMNDGTVYFVGQYEGEWGIGIFRSRFVNDAYLAPEPLGPHINTSYADAYPFIDPDGRFLLFASSRPGAASTETDLYISVCDERGNFAEPVRLGPEINNGRTVSFSCLSPDGKYLFFNRFTGEGDESTDVFYWVDAKILSPYLQAADN